MQRTPPTHLPRALVGLLLQPHGPVLRVGVGAVVHAEDDGPGQNHSWGAAADYRAEEGLATSERQSVEEAVELVTGRLWVQILFGHGCPVNMHLIM